MQESLRILEGAVLKHQTICLLIIALAVGSCCKSQADDSRDPKSIVGLGMTKQGWEQLHGESVWRDSAQSRYEAPHGTYLISFSNGKVSTIILEYKDSSNVSLESARAFTKTLVPSDAELRDEQQPNGTSLVEYYYSKSLAQLFPKEDWGYSAAGQFQIQYDRNGSATSRLIVELGHR